MEFTGTIIAILNPQKVSEKMEKQTIVLESIEDKYPQKIAFEAINDKMIPLAGKKVGDKVLIDFSLRGREWQGKYFVNLSINRIEKVQDATPEKQPKAPASPSEDLPF